MSAESRSIFDPPTVAVVLKGGPEDLPPSERQRHIPQTATKVKVPHLGGHEHFERDEGNTSGPGGPVVFRWTMRTRVAE
ncbi:DUF5988 family protein [Micromonospora sp. NPDC085948]|uniref:DUF5988 family protein n=1 Tax=Micromonospora sp. NPDC085948 TaxID=3155293 RepID=UPI003430AB8E